VRNVKPDCNKKARQRKRERERESESENCRDRKSGDGQLSVLAVLVLFSLRLCISVPARRVILRSKLSDVGMFGPGLSRRREALKCVDTSVEFPVLFDVDTILFPMLKLGTSGRHCAAAFEDPRC